MDIFRFGAEKVGNTSRIKKGLLYQDGRGKEARVHDYFDGIVVLGWLDTGKQSQCNEQQFCKRFSLYGNGHEEPERDGFNGSKNNKRTGTE